MLYFGIFGLEFENTIVIFEINPPPTKNALSGYFWAVFILEIKTLKFI